IPTSIDWRQKGAVTPVRNQGGCGSCWTFSSVAAVEGINKIVTGQLLSLSEQELLDCERRSYGCRGGFPLYALQYVANSGIHLRQYYPYEGVQRQCRASQAKGPKVKTDGVGRVPRNNEQALIQRIAIQPVSIVVEAKGRAFQNYRGGIFAGPCGTSIDHAVAAVGYGNDYILIKNSWGTGWGEGGYIRIKRGSGNPQGACGVLSDSVFPTKNR
uniref:CMS1MS2 n=1 Tax=Vasconcellea cundinamarcensis TaxID=35926 RepID=UPI0000602D68|nr:Chain A, CMS1MS2 [Vasconcellea cundinamarcensis]